MALFACEELLAFVSYARRGDHARSGELFIHGDRVECEPRRAVGRERSTTGVAAAIEWRYAVHPTLRRSAKDGAPELFGLVELEGWVPKFVLV